MDVAHRLVWPKSVDRAADNLSDAECNERGGAGPDGCGNSDWIVMLAAVDERDDGRWHDP